MMQIIKTTVLAGILVMPGLAYAVGIGVGLQPFFRTNVTPLPDGSYEVEAIGTSAPVAYWCGIGDYAIRTLRTKATQRIYISKAYEPGVRRVQFVFEPPEGADTSTGYSVTVKRVGANLTAASAQGHCYDNFLDSRF